MSGFAARLGIFAKTFVRQRPVEVAAAVKAAGYPLAHWNFAAIGLPTLASGVDDAVFVAVRAAFDAEGLRIPSVSATFNAIEPGPHDVHRAVRLIGLAPLLGADVVTLCTGTRDRTNMWRAHPANGSARAWRDLRATLDPLLSAADAAGVVLGVEPEAGNVVRDAAAAARLLAELGDDAPAGIVFDPANLLHPGADQRQVLTEAIDLLGPRVVSTHVKDLGTLDRDLVLRLLDRLPAVPVIVQDVAEHDAAAVRAHLVATR
ncbi:sugar phosphate isomerase/epimerase [Nocardia sp. NRRL S-836]|uniref:sugar phosphate isomerase/epimerase family protein n=1 Tax=Nocardia sp. NRRL S-836 TaxID=1519492 RepID=UPI0006AEA9D1|nr:TIM barrel protein [Nocardia sp. NRRL S-836]